MEGAMTPEVRTRISKLIPRLASDHAGEVVATVEAIRKTLVGAGADFHDLARLLAEPQPQPHGLTPWPSSPFSAAATAAKYAALSLNAKIAILSKLRDRMSPLDQKFVIAMALRAAGTRSPRLSPDELARLELLYRIYSPKEPTK
jgi:hypothetical protein